MTAADQAPLEGLVEKFQLSNEAANLSPKTIRWYEDLLTLFLHWLDSSGIPPTLASFTLECVESYVHHLKQRPNHHTGARLSTLSVRAHVVALKVFANYLAERGYTERNVVRGLKNPKTEPTPNRTLSDAEIERVLRAAQTGGGAAFRNYCIVCTFLDTGMRLSELAGLTWEDVRLDEGSLDVNGKGRKRRTVPVSRRVRELLLRYSERHRPATVPRPDEPFFVTEDGAALSANAISLMIKRLGKRSGVPRLHAHIGGVCGAMEETNRPSAWKAEDRFSAYDVPFVSGLVHPHGIRLIPHLSWTPEHLPTFLCDELAHMSSCFHCGRALIGSPAAIQAISMPSRIGPACLGRTYETPVRLEKSHVRTHQLTGCRGMQRPPATPWHPRNAGRLASSQSANCRCCHRARSKLGGR